ncbi:MAG: aspartate--tRNA(Asn) ligase [Thaumarchaeota archaeon]|nr:aspartate--tRNA(Asn) ligase [Nitrososphaerota archaeon]
MQKRLGWLDQRTHTTRNALQAKEGEQVRLLGWVHVKNQVGGIIFLTVRDGEGFIQAAGKKGVVSEQVFEDLKKVTRESAVMVGGTVRGDKRAPGGKEVSVKEFEIVALSDDWPITKSAVKSASYLYDMRHLSIRGRKASAVMKVRAEVISGAFEHFVDNGFILISAPTIVQNAVEGGSTLFELNYFGSKAYLSQSAQLYEEAAINALEKVFIFQPAFRAEKSKTSKHLTEFWMIEAEQAFASQEDNMKLQENLLCHICRRVAEKRSAELSILGRRFNPPEPPLPRISYDEAIHFASSKGIPIKWGEDITTEAERLLSESQDKPFFITGYPLSTRSFYHMTNPDDPRQVTMSADLIAPEGHGELATGGQRIHDYKLLEDRIKGQELPPEAFGWYLGLRKYGLPPHAGFGMGAERATKWICGLKHIRATSLFPRTITRVTP